MAYGKYTGFKGWLYKGSTPYHSLLHSIASPQWGSFLFVGVHVLLILLNAAGIGYLGDNDQYHLRILVVPNSGCLLRALPYFNGITRCHPGYMAKAA